MTLAPVFFLFFLDRTHTRLAPSSSPVTGANKFGLFLSFFLFFFSAGVGI